MKSIKTQEDIVRAAKGFREKYETRKLKLPGIETLHTKTLEEIAEVLAIALKSQSNVVEVRYRVGEHVELTYEVI